MAHDAFPILTSLVALPIVGALLLLLVRDDERSEARRSGRSRWSSRCWSSPRRCCCGRGSTPASADFQFVERHAWIPAFGISYCGRRRRHQPAAARPDRLPDAARAPELVGVGAQEDARVLHVRAAARERDDRRVRLARSVPLLRVLGRDAHPDVLPHRDLGLRPPHLRRGQVHPLHDGRQRADAAGDPRPRLRCTARRAGGYSFDLLQLYELDGAGATCSSGSSSRSRWRSPSRCRCSRSTPGCPTRTSRRRPPAR